MKKSTATGDTSLLFARKLTSIVNSEWEKGDFIRKVSPITEDLLNYWFSPAFCDNRTINFHSGQRQAILNAIYCHEILAVEGVLDMYQKVCVNGELNVNFLEEISEEEYLHPKYCVKMATGTGKTWCMNALFLWQYLNASFPCGESKCSYTKNFLFIAPGLIVYERLLDSFLGKENSQGQRDFESSDLKRYEKLFIPERYREKVYSFVGNSFTRKEEIGTRVVSDGIIAVTNWHAISLERGKETENNDTQQIVRDLLPLPLKRTNNPDLGTLDRQFLDGGELEYLNSLDSICVFNDEAHHIHDKKSKQDQKEIKWKEALNYLSRNKGSNYIQIDFSATPYEVSGSGQKRTKRFFPHVIIDFDLRMAVKNGLVKLLAIDKRKEIASLANAELDYSSIKEGRNVISLSDGQRLMLRVGLQRLRLLEQEFSKINPDKHPKMLVICEDTKVSPHVVTFLQQEGLNEEDVLRIDSDKKGDLNQKEWNHLKQSLFDIDNRPTPKVIVSVLMLREGFDVSSVCVIVPLRSSQAPILLEQVVGRGLRLMWREPEYDSIKEENRERMLKKQEPNGQYDILHIVEHPAYIEFYEDLDKDLLIEEFEEPTPSSVLGDLISVNLKKDYSDYDFYIPMILKDREEYLTRTDLEAVSSEKYPWKLSQLQRMLNSHDAESIIAKDVLVSSSIFGEFKVRGDLFNAGSYNEYIAKIVHSVTTNIQSKSTRKHRFFPSMQVNQADLAGFVDHYIRFDLFGEPFNPLEGQNWRILMLEKSGIVQHLLSQIAYQIDKMQKNVQTTEADVKRLYFSNISKIHMRSKYALDIKKSIYEKTAYPSNKGEFEREFMLYADADGMVERLLKIDPNYHHDFVGLRYIRTDGHFGLYFPDFLVKISDDIYVVETKAERDLRQEDVKRKAQGATEWIKRINELSAEYRMDSVWHYVVLSDSNFYIWKKASASILDMMEPSEIHAPQIEGRLL